MWQNHPYDFSNKPAPWRLHYASRIFNASLPTSFHYFNIQRSLMTVQVSHVNKVSVGNPHEEFAVQAARWKLVLSFCLLVMQTVLCHILGMLSHWQYWEVVKFASDLLFCLFPATSPPHLVMFSAYSVPLWAQCSAPNPMVLNPLPSPSTLEPNLHPWSLRLALAISVHAFSPILFCIVLSCTT